jgi:hypothetical protein
MKRFDDDNEEFGEDVDRFFERDEEKYISEEEYEELVRQANELQNVQLELVELDINQRMLADCIAMCEKSWFWRFKPMKARLKEIGIAYRYFQKLTDAKGQNEK